MCYQTRSDNSTLRQKIKTSLTRAHLPKEDDEDDDDDDDGDDDHVDDDDDAGFFVRLPFQ